MDTAPGPVWDAVVVPAEAEEMPTLSTSTLAVNFVQDIYRHCKPILVLGAERAARGGARALLRRRGQR